MEASPTLVSFKTNVIAAIQSDHAGHSLVPADWSGFATVRKEGGAVLYSASLKRSIPSTVDPKDIKPFYQRQPVTGFALQYVEGIEALFGESYIDRVQLVFKSFTPEDLRKQIDLLNSMLNQVSVHK